MNGPKLGVRCSVGGTHASGEACILCERLKPWHAQHACLTRLQHRDRWVVIGAAANIAPGGVAAYQHLHGGRPL